MKKILVGTTLVLLVLIAAWPLVAQEEGEEEVPEAEPNPVAQPTGEEEIIDPNDPNLRWCHEGAWFGPCREIEGWTPSDPRKTHPPPVGSKEHEMGRPAREAKAREVLPPCPQNPGKNLEEGYCIDSEGWVYSAKDRSRCVDGAGFGICADRNGKLGRGDRLPNGIRPP